MFLQESPQTYGGSAHIPQTALQDVGYTARDLALCSTEAARALIPFERARMLNVLPLAIVGPSGEKKLHCVALSDSASKQKELRFATGCEVLLTAVPIAILEDALIRAYLGSETRFHESFKKIALEALPLKSSDVGDMPSPQGDAACFLQNLLEYAFTRNASDIHLTPVQNGCLLKLRIDGELLQQRDQQYAKTFHDQIVNRLKVLSNLDIATKFLPQDGAISMVIGKHTRDVRVSIIPSIYGESVVLRLAAVSQTLYVSELGIEPITLSILKDAMRHCSSACGGGIILLTGPTGSGKTTTMYSVVSELDRAGLQVVTVEDPVETKLLGPVQIQVRNEQGFSFAKAIRAVLRHDPDVVLIGEIRDGESARTALEVASTGHLTLSSLHISSALQAIARLEVLGVPRRESVAVLSLVLNQRLLPRLCPKCRKQDDGCKAQTTYTSPGCSACAHTGHSGLVLVTELLDLRAVGTREVLAQCASPSDIIEEVSSSAFIRWERSLEHHLTKGHISLRQLEEFIEAEVV